ncbi:MAG: LysE family transporter [Thermoleophilaceae bacterium]
MNAVLVGFGLGFVVAAQVGPISLLLIRAVMRGAYASGLAIGAGAAIIDTTYAALGALGAGRLLGVEALRLTLGIAGALVLAYFALRTLRDAFRVRIGGELPAEIASPRRALTTSLAATASNPLTIISWAAAFSAASTAAAAHSTSSSIALIAGVGIGSISWFVILATGLRLAHRRVGERFVQWVDFGAGLGLLGFAGVLGVKTVQDA